MFPPIPKITGINTSWACDDNADYLKKYQTLPVIPYAELQEHMDSIYLLNEAQFKFQPILKKLRRRGLKPILHTGWRFPEQSKRSAPFVKIFAGKQSSEQLSYLADDQADNNFISLVPKPITRKKAQPDSNLWQLEGLIKIHVNHYLYVTSELDILFDTEDNKTQTARLSQFTRVYSGDIHYLDNPKLGVIFQIRKYQH